MKQRTRNRYGVLDQWMSRRKPHLFKLMGGAWFCTALNGHHISRGAYGATPAGAYNNLMSFLATEHFGLRD